MPSSPGKRSLTQQIQAKGRSSSPSAAPQSAVVQQKAGSSPPPVQDVGGAIGSMPYVQGLQAAFGPGGVVQRQEDPQASTPAQESTPPGRGVCTEYGDYWIVPDDTTMTYANVEGEQITETAFAELTDAWNSIRDGSGNIRISETGRDGTEYAGFQARTLQQFGRLLSRPTGRQLVMDLLNGSHTVTVVPGRAGMVAGAARGAGSLENADGSAGAGGDTTIVIEAGLSDTDMVCFDRDGNELSAPVFTILGHELIHARHNAAGRNRRNVASTDAAYPNREEQETIETGADLTENMIRAEHGLEGERHGHRARDTRRP